jgi:hypothetical protein
MGGRKAKKATEETKSKTGPQVKVRLILRTANLLSMKELSAFPEA